MKILVLECDRGYIWGDCCVIQNADESSRAARHKLYQKFAEYWFHIRFPIMSDRFIIEIGKLLERNGWKVKELNGKI